MEIIYHSERLEKQCTDLNKAKNVFGGQMKLAVSLLARINAIEQAETLKDIVVMPTFRFHNLKNKNGRDLKGYFAIDVKTRRDPWRIILQPLDENEEPYENVEIDKVAFKVRIVEIMEVSNHYE